MKKKVKSFKVIIALLCVSIILLSVLFTKYTTQIRQHSTPRNIKAYTTVTQGEDITSTQFVTFDAFFSDGTNRYRGIRQELNNSVTLTLNLNVLTNGSLQNASVTFDNDNNYVMVKNVGTDEYINSVSTNKIVFNTIPLGVNKTINVTLKQGVISGSKFTRNKLSKTNKLTLQGTHVAQDGTRTEITKDVFFKIDWHGEIKFETTYSLGDNWNENAFVVSEKEQKVYALFKPWAHSKAVGSSFIMAPDKAVVINAKIPQLEGFDPTNVYVYDISEYKKELTYNYDSTTRSLDIRMENPLSAEDVGNVISSTYMYRPNIVVEYPKEAYTSFSTGRFLIIDTNTYLEGYSTDEDGNIITVESPVGSDTAAVKMENPQGDMLRFEIDYNRSNLSKANMRLNYENDLDLKTGYKVDWNLRLNLNENIEKLIFTEDYSASPDLNDAQYMEDTDHFVAADGNIYDMSSFVSYEGIRVDNSAFNVLGEDGFIDVFNTETNELVKRITYEDVNTIIKYETPIKHIRVETCEPLTVGNIRIENFKVIDNQIMKQTYNKDLFETFEGVYSAMKGSIKYKDLAEEQAINGDVELAPYDEGSVLFYAKLLNESFHPQKLNTSEMRFGFLNYDSEDRNYITWIDPVIFIEFPSTFKNVIYNSFTLEDEDGMEIVDTKVEEINGKLVLKIYTKGMVLREKEYYLKFQSEIDEFTTETADKIRVFAVNRAGDYWQYYYGTSMQVPDIYDVDGDLDVVEETRIENNDVFYSEVNQLVTTTQISDFDNKGTIVEGPEIANVDKNIKDTARINIRVSNGYKEDVTNVKIVGRIPFEGNEHVINSSDLGSKYSTTLNSTGINNSNGLSNYTVYYSENENATKEFTAENNWVTIPTNWNNVKSYMIDFGANVIPTNAIYNFYYDITIPDNLKYGDVAYATHAIFFDSKDANGLFTETDKVGLKIATEKTYRINIKDYKFNTNETITKATEKEQTAVARIFIKGENFGDTYYWYSNVGTETDKDAVFDTLYPGVIYSIKQRDISSPYKVNDQEITFRLNYVDGNYEFELLSGNTRNIPTVEKVNGKLIVNLEIENMYNYNLILRNKQKDSDELINGSTFKVTTSTEDITQTATDGTTIFKDMPEDTLNIVQTAVGENNFQLNSNIHTLTISRDGNGLLQSSNLKNLTNEKITIENKFTEQPNIYVDIENEYIDAKVNVYYYLEGDDSKTPLSNTVVINGKLYDEYETSPANDIDLNKYELSSVVGIEKGTMDTALTEVYYYYKLKTFDISTQVTGNGGKITGQDLPKIDTVEYGKDSEETITVVPDDGYKISKITINGVEQPITPDVDGSYTLPKLTNIMEDTIITAEFELAEYEYSVEYYYDGVKDDSKTENGQAIFGTQITTYTDKNIVGSKLEKVENNPLTITSNVTNNIMRVYYQREDVSYSVEYYYDGIKDDSKTVVTQVKFGDLISEYTDKVINGYKLEKTENLPLTVSLDDAQNIIKVYYIKDNFDYIVEYYYDGVKDDTKTETLSAKYQDIINTYTDKNIKGYKLEKTENLPLTIDFNESNNVIKIYYVLNDADTKDLSYTVEYYKDGVLDTDSTQVFTESVQVLAPDTITVDKSKIDLSNKYNGYKLEKTEPAVLPDAVNNGDTIKVYYVKDMFNYTVEYYYDNVKDDTKTETLNATYQDIINTYTDKNIKGYKLEKTENLPLTIDFNEANNLIKVYYVINDADTKDLNYTVEYYKDGVLDTDSTQVFTESVQVLAPDTITVDKSKIDLSNKYNGYKFEKTEPVVLPDVVNNGDTIKVYYVKDSFDYTVEYYYDGVKDDTKTETLNATFESVVTNYLDKEINGYRLEKTENNPLTIASDSSNNVMKVYYVKDEFEYKIEYYYDGIKDDTKTEILSATFESVVTNYTDKIINGYKFEKVENNPLTITSDSNNNVMKVYYVKDEFEYRVEYYYNNILDDSKTEISKATFKDIITDYTDKNVNGYKFEKVENNPLTITSNTNNNVIKVYYVSDEFEYTVEYYYDDVLDSTKTDILKAKYQDIINTYEDKNIKGYMLDKAENLPLTVDFDEVNNVIKIYYVLNENDTKDLSYTVEYYKDGVLDKASTQEFTENVQVLALDTLSVDKSKIDLSNKYNGYKFEKTEPAVLPDVVNNGETIKVYYAKESYNYTIEYYYDGVKDDTKTETLNAMFETEITTYPDKAIKGYKVEKTENLPLTIDFDENNNIIRIYYAINDDDKKELSYTVEYYKDGVLDKDRTQVFTESVQVLAPDTLTVDKSKINLSNKYIGYKFEKTEPAALPDVVNNGDIIRVYYVKDTFNYTIEYYYEGIKDNSKTELLTAKYQDVINTYPDKVIENYTLGKVDGLPLVISELSASNVIKIYYVKKSINYTVEYYYDGVREDTATQHRKAKLGDIIKTYIDKEEYGYEFEKTENLPLTITNNESQNVIKVYYKKKIAEIKIKYLDITTLEEVEVEETVTGKYFDPYDITGKEKDIADYTLVEVPDELIGVHKKDETKVYYYAKNTEVTVKYIDKNTNEELLPEEIIKGYETKEYKATYHDIENYTFVRSTDNTEGKMTATPPIEVIYYYAKNTNIIINHIDKKTNEILDVVEDFGKVGDTYKAESKDFDGYVVVEKPEQEIVILTEETIQLNYYYIHVSAGVLEKHIDITTNEIIEDILHEGNEGDEYTTDSKKFEGYDLVEEKLPENANGIMTIDLIEVKYYYIRKTSVVAQYIDKITGEKLVELDKETNTEKDSTEVILGHEGDNYTTEEKEFENYSIVKEEYPENKDGIMTVTYDETGKPVTETTVTYYYVHDSAGVIEKHIDVITGKELEKETVYEGHEGDLYETKPKEFEGYDVVKEKLPENAKGAMTIDLIEVNYYYIRKTKVTVEYIDIITGERLTQVDEKTNAEKDSTEVILGHEGDSYTTEEKEFEKYVIVKEKYPENKEGIMTISTNEDGEVETEIIVKYYYAHESAGVVEKHIDVVTGKLLEKEKIYTGNEGDEYTTKSKDFDGYDVVEEKLPENANGKMEIDQIEVKYYYARKTKVIVRYLEEKTNNPLLPMVEIEGHETEEYVTENKNIDGYELVKLPKNNKGKMTIKDIEVTYIYKKKPQTNTKPSQDNGQNMQQPSNPQNPQQPKQEQQQSQKPTISNNQNKPITTITSPNTGDNVPIIAIVIILIILIANLVQIKLEIVKKKKQ